MSIDFFRANWIWDQDYPLSQMCRCGDFLLLAGQVPLDEKGQLVGAGDLREQSRQVFRNMQAVLSLVGCDLTSVVRLTNYFTVSLADGSATEAYWGVRREFFGSHKPPSTGLQISGLMLPEMMLEVDAIAFAPR